MTGMWGLQAAQQRFTAETETERWRAMEGVLEFASFCDAGACSRSFAGTTRVRILAEVLQALDAAHDDTLITLLRCLRSAHSHFNFITFSTEPPV